MNRTLLFITVIISITLTSMQIASAQSIKASFGIKGGGVTTMMPVPEAATLNIGGYGGLFLGLKYGKTIGFQAEVDYSLQGTKYNLDGLSVKTSQQYIHIPLVLQIWAGRAVVFEVGYQQSILVRASLYENGEHISSFTNETNPYGNDPGAHKYYGSILAGATFNLGKVLFLNLRYAYGISNSYSIYNEAYPCSTAQIGIGFRIYNSKRSIYK